MGRNVGERDAQSAELSKKQLNIESGQDRVLKKRD
jgi:hypothetical protein